LGSSADGGHVHVVHDDLAGDRRAQAELPSIFGAVRPFIPFSSTKPRIAPSSSFAHTTNTSAIGALLIHILLPESR
jgi:hypothetical protein